MSEILLTAWWLLCESAIFVLVGFLIGGGLHVLISTERVIRFLSAKKARSVLLAAAIGLPLPLCSCAVLPATVSLRRKGASRGATLSFLISTPETGVSSVLLSYSLLGPIMAIFRPIAACVTALVAGLVENAIDRRWPQPEPANVAGGPAEGECCEEDRGRPAESRGWRAALRYAFVDLFDGIAGWVLVGVAAAAVLQQVLPEVVFRSTFAGPLESMLLMAAVGVPLYVCAEASTPIAAVFMAQGLNPGAALVFLLVGPATNIGSIGALKGLLGRRTIAVYLACIVVTALVMGALLNNLLAGDAGPRLSTHVMHESLVPTWAKVVGAIVFLALFGLTVRRRRYVLRLAGWLDARLPVRVTPRRLVWAAIATAILLHLASGLFAVQPGEAGVVRRFGAVRRANVPPGLHYALPCPIERVDRVPVGRVHRTVIGFRAGAGGAIRVADNPEESWTLLGDENIADLRSVVHWGARADRTLRFQYSAEAPEKLVRSVVESIVREVLGGGSINRVFTAERQALESAIESAIRARLDAYDSGIRLDAFRFLYAHAPPQVHASFRDVAGAMEDRAATIHQALTDEAKMLPEARGQAAKQHADARGYETRIVTLAKGQSDRFVRLLAVYRDWPAITRKRLHFEMLDEVLPGRPKYVRPSEPSAGETEIWLVEPSALGKVPLDAIPAGK